MKRKTLLILISGAIVGLGATPAHGQAYTVTPMSDSPIIDPSTLGGYQYIPGANNDDGYSEVSFGGATFSFYGVDWTSAYVNSNGFLTFGAGDYDYTESINEFLSPEPRVGIFWDDLNPSKAPPGSGVFANIDDGRLIVTWLNVPEYYTTGSNTFQIILHFSTGLITMNFDSLSARDCIVGIGPGTGYVYNGQVDFTHILGLGGQIFGNQEAIVEQFLGYSNDLFDMTHTSLAFSGEVPDTDGDGIYDPDDNCPTTYNPDQLDSDGDGFGDVCDVCPYDEYNDADGDGVCGDVDNCLGNPNPDQTDTDADGWGDGCDNCRTVYNPDQADLDGDGIGDLCEPVQIVGITEDGGTCLEAEVLLFGENVYGTVKVLGMTQVVPESITFEILNTRCNHNRDTFRFWLNGVYLGSTLADPTYLCTCAPALQYYVISNSALIASVWRSGQENAIWFEKCGWEPYNWFAWVRARLEADGYSETVCVYDYQGGDCR
jgi:hypothetical protein